MDIAGMTLLGAFLLGLVHTLEPCEDKAVVSLFIMWAAKRLSEAILLVVIYGLGMALVDTALGFIFSYLGVALLESYKTPLEAGAGVITAIFGLYMITVGRRQHLGHHHGVPPAIEGNRASPGTLGIFALGLMRGLPPCPVELAILAWAASAGSILQGTLMVFVFGLGTTLGLIPLALIMGGIAGAAKRTRYSHWIPWLSGIVLTIVGVLLVLAALIGIEI